MDSTNIERAIEILNRERQAIQPTKRELLFFRIFRYVTYVFLLALVVLIAALVYFDSDSLQVTFLFYTAIATFIATVPLFFMNVRLMRKLWRHARLRRELHLTDYLKAAFRSRRKKGRFGNILALVAGAFGAFLVIVSVAMGVFLPLVEDAATIIFVLLVVVLPLAVVGASLVSLYFMRKAKQKLDELDVLQASLTAEQPSLGSENYYRIADMERDQIIRERRQSISQSQKKALQPVYVVQTSREARITKSQLDAEMSNKVDHAIFELMNERGTTVMKGSQGELRQVSVPGTPMSISYQVDEESKRIRIFSLESSSKENATTT